MIKFFRKIRQQLLTENKFSKYFIYAIGEIILVVIGILIALSINNWNEDRKDRKAEAQALIDLKMEFDRNQELLELLTSTKQQLENEGRAYLNIITDSTIPFAEKIKTNPPGPFKRSWNTTNAVLNGLLSTGDLGKIRNDSLKYLLTNWSDKVDNWNEVENRYINAEDARINYLASRIYEPVIKEGTHDFKFPGNYFPNNIDGKNDSLRVSFIDDILYYNLNREVILSLYIQLVVAKELEKDYEKIVHLIDFELNNRIK